MPPTRSRPTALGVYIYAGGFTLGVKKHFDVKGHCEGPNPYGLSVIKANMPGLPVYAGFDKWPATKVDFVYGNPPCAAWSQNNPKSRDGWQSDARLSCTREHFTMIQATGCKVWVWESVCNAPTRGKEFVDLLTNQALKMGYSVSQVFHDAQYLGCAQTRKRWFMVCHNVEFTPIMPDWKVIAVTEALKGVVPRGEPASDGKGHIQFIKHWKNIRPGQRLRDYWERSICPEDKRVLTAQGTVKGRCGLGHIKLKPNQPATATVGYAMMHPTKPRFLHVNEVQALAGFPQEYVIDRGSKYGSAELDLIARGVCPPVGEWIAKAAAIAIKKNMPVKVPTTYVYDFRTPPEVA